MLWKIKVNLFRKWTNLANWTWDFFQVIMMQRVIVMWDKLYQIIVIMCHLDKLLHFIRIMSLNVAGISLAFRANTRHAQVSQCSFKVLHFMVCELNPKPFKNDQSTLYHHGNRRDW